ncbi:MAG: NADH-quinone oxidoreductase subunit L [Alphaproteobacteria bacterium GM202ARS2]|nr:NADH-quinone oxidoreductase subunit L [Alphaproteobacteria bacterium GM202ARS2]
MNAETLKVLSVMTVFLPCLASFVAFAMYSVGFREQRDGARARHRLGAIIVCALLLLSAISALIMAVGYHQTGEVVHVFLADWFQSGGLQVAWQLRIDSLSVLMLALVSFIAAWICVYSLGYMRKDETMLRFFCYMALFTFSMQLLVSADNALMLFVGWEGVGLCSYLLIGYDHDRAAANNAAMKAFVVNRVGDFSFILGLILLAVLYGSLDMDVLLGVRPSLTFIEVAGYRLDGLSLACALLFVGAMAKSAQWGLHIWLADAMEGPTPVSALIHAATMVTAGVFMIARLSPIFASDALILDIMVVVGGLTALLASLCAAVQYDIKRTIAWSTCSQLGYMVVALGLSAWSAALFHLVTHAFFKALLFLGAGSVIYALHHQQDMRQMGGLAKQMPATCSAMWIGCIALAGLPFFSGYYSKDMIIELAWGGQNVVASFGFACLFLAAIATAYYSMRMMLMTFHLPASQQESTDIARESPMVMMMPMMVLALFAVMAGAWWRDWFVGDNIAFWGNSLAPHKALMDKLLDGVPAEWLPLPVVVSVLSMQVALLMYGFYGNVWHTLRTWVASGHGLLQRGWGMDQLYKVSIIAFVRGLARESASTIEKDMIDGLGPDGVAHTVQRFARRVALWHDGRLFVYAFMMIAAAVVFVLWRGAAWSLFSLPP